MVVVALSIAHEMSGCRHSSGKGPPRERAALPAVPTTVESHRVMRVGTKALQSRWPSDLKGWEGGLLQSLGAYTRAKWPVLRLSCKTVTAQCV